MSPEEHQFGRRRTKKPRPVFPQAEDASLTLPPDSAPPAAAPASDIQASLDIPVPDVSAPEPHPVESPKEETPQVEAKPEQPIPSIQREPPKPRQERPHRHAGIRTDDHRERGERRERGDRAEREQRPRERPQARPVPVRRNVRVSVIVPAYNEEDNIKPLMDMFGEVISRAGSDWEVVLVDDGSTDKTAERGRDAAIRYNWLRVVGYRTNRGLTAALETGFQNARGSIYVFYPADLQYHPQDIPRMINRVDRGADIVTGWKQGRYQKRFVSFIYNKLCRALFKVKVHDLNSVKAFKKDVLDKIRLRRDWHRYMVVIAAELGFNIDEVKVNVYPRHAGKSKFGTGRILGGLLDLLAVKFQVSFTKKPLRFFGTWGVLSMLAGLITGLTAVYLRFFTIHGSRVWLYLVILFVLSGLMLFSLGFLAEVIVSLRDDIESLKGKKLS
jgi:glycosyltransferase involved in cell wall biosynthesis